MGIAELLDGVDTHIGIVEVGVAALDFCFRLVGHAERNSLDLVEPGLALGARGFGAVEKPRHQSGAASDAKRVFLDSVVAIANTGLVGKPTLWRPARCLRPGLRVE